MKNIDLSLITNFNCNMNCKFCYSYDFHNSKDVLDITSFYKVLNEYDVRILDIYGGEISLLPSEYVKSLVDAIPGTIEQVFLVSNSLGFKESEWFSILKSDNRFKIAFSYDLQRPRIDEVRKSIYEFDKLGINYSVICIDLDDLDYDFLDSLDNIESISIKPFSQSSAMPKIRNVPYMKHILQTLHDNHKRLFDKLELVGSYRDAVPHMFLLPDGKLYDIRYENGEEYFCQIEKCDYNISNNCLKCKYYNRCFNEHYFGYSCNESDECIGRKAAMEYLDGLYNLR